MTFALVLGGDALGGGESRDVGMSSCTVAAITQMETLLTGVGGSISSHDCFVISATTSQQQADEHGTVCQCSNMLFNLIRI